MFSWEKQLKTLVKFNIMSSQWPDPPPPPQKKVSDDIKCDTNWICNS